MVVSGRVCVYTGFGQKAPPCFCCYISIFLDRRAGFAKSVEGPSGEGLNSTSPQKGGFTVRFTLSP